MNSKNIEEQLDYRLKHTNAIYNSIDTDNIEFVQTVYFKYYFDLSTSIESVAHAILINKYSNDNYIAKELNLNKKGEKSFFLSTSDVELIFEGFGKDFKVESIYNRFNSKCDVIKESFYQLLGFETKIFSINNFKEHYGQARKTRNQLAHDISFYNIQLNNQTLYKFMVSYFVLIEFLKTIEGS